MTQPRVAILMGSNNDLKTMRPCMETLTELGVSHEARILSAHRTPEKTADFVKQADKNGCQVFIAAAGLAAHLAGAVAANTIKPVIGVPLDAGTLGGLDALLATVQMPGGTPVATTSIGSHGAKNAAVLAAEILALQDEQVRAKLMQMRSDKRELLMQQDQALNLETV